MKNPTKEKGGLLRDLRSWSSKNPNVGLEGAASGTGTTQAGKAGAFTTMTHEQGTKLEGLFTSGQMHWANIDDRVEDVSAKMDIASEHLRKIEENTGDCKDSLSAIKEDIKKIILQKEIL